MNRRLRQIRTAVISLAVGAVTLTGCSVYDAPLPGGPDTGEDPITVTARFRDVLDLVPQSTVKLDDVDVGKVTGVELDGYVAEVTMDIRQDAEIPDDVAAQIRQTSLLGEKFVSLEIPEDASAQRLTDRAVIGLDRTGRNPEIEEVFSALALLLNGGGVGQLKSITEELNLALDGRSDDVKSVLRQIRTFMGTLDDNRASIIAALENTNRLAAQAREQQGTIEAALDDVPGALRSLNRQRADLVALLESLDRLSAVGTQVIRDSKEATINTLEDLGPVLKGFADAGQDFPKAINVYLTYPFVDEAVGRDPQVARNLHIGDYTNLSIDLDIDLADLPLPDLEIPNPLPAVCPALRTILETTRDNVNRAASQAVDALPANPLITAQERERLKRVITRRLIGAAVETATDNCEVVSVNDILADAGALIPTLLETLRILTPAQVQQLLDGTLGQVGGALGGSGSGGLLGGSGSGLLGGGTGGLLNRPAPGADPRQIDPFGLAAYGLDPGIGTMLFQGVASNR